MISIPEILRLLHNLIRLGHIEQLDLASARVRVRSGEALTDWLPWIAIRAGESRTWDPPSVGEQVIILSPGGDLAAAVVLLGIYQASCPPPSQDPAVWRRAFPDGAEIEYDHEKHAGAVTLPSGGTLRVTSDGGVQVTGDGLWNGNFQVNGNISASGDIVADGNVADGTRSMVGDREIYNSHKHPAGTPMTGTTAEQQ